MVCWVLFVESGELEPEEAVKSALGSHREGMIEAGPFTRPRGSPSRGEQGTPGAGGGWGASPGKAATGRARLEGDGLPQPGALWVSDPGVIHPPHEDREPVPLVPEQEEEGLLHFEDQQIAGHGNGRGRRRLHAGLRQLECGLVLHRRNLKIHVLRQPAQVDVVKKVKEF